MPRRAFLADLQAAVSGSLPERFSDLQHAEDDGAFTIAFQPFPVSHEPVILQVTVTVDDYPAAHDNFVFVVSEAAPSYIQDAVADASQFASLRVAQVITKIARLLKSATAGSSHNPILVDIDGSQSSTIEELSARQNNNLDEDEDEETDYDFDEDEDDDEIGFDRALGAGASDMDRNISNSSASTNSWVDRIRRDLHLLKSAGFYVSAHGNPYRNNCQFYLTIACRIAKFNVSDEALEAWNLSSKKYFHLILNYASGYRPLEDILDPSGDKRNISRTVEFRTAVCESRKASRRDVVGTFARTVGNAQKRDINSKPELSNSNLEKFFLDRPLEELLNGYFSSILHIRNSMNLSWEGAERYLRDNQGFPENQNNVDEAYWRPDDPIFPTNPHLEIADHFSSMATGRSFPLIAMEFTLRHLIRCTEFCLVCHTQFKSDFQALKPYVCSKPLCLYQYMSLGFGPSVEHEILSQPYVVDLLISFCYERAAVGKLNDLPSGLGLKFPLSSRCRDLDYLPSLGAHASASQLTLPVLLQSSTTQIKPTHGPIGALYRPGTERLKIPEVIAPSFKVGDWIALSQGTDWSMEGQVVYRQINDKGPALLLLSQPRTPASETDNSTTKRPEWLREGQDSFDVLIHNSSSFDDLGWNSQQAMICSLLDMLPSVVEMKSELDNNRDKVLSQIFPDIPSSAMLTLRWILASNRSCIVAIDDPASGQCNSKDRVRGMSGYLQFRFAQGAPDKEQRFISAVSARQAHTMKQHPTIWAWHGSPVHNWHSIIRDGLHFSEVVNGRSYGNGVYHAKIAHTSLGYASRGHAIHRVFSSGWSQSQLKISTALSLNEIVNDPLSFTSFNPHLVVQHVDWIQTRYLFVSHKLPAAQGVCLDDNVSSKIVDELPQDPSWTAQGVFQSNIVLPSNAVSVSRRAAFQMNSSKSGRWERIKLLGKRKPHESVFSDDGMVSDATDDEDSYLLRGPESGLKDGSERKSAMPHTYDKHKEAKRNFESKTAFYANAEDTDFVAGTLDPSSLDILPAPPYATPSATKTLARELMQLQSLQSSTPPAVLGWHLCEAALDNMYQWILELHTFDQSLPLSQDLKSKGITSVVLELRFGPQYPFSPPFVRIVRPRFLDFRKGGGGHVTAGGALCMELLTNDGWSAVSSIEAVLLQVRMAISSRDPQPARLAPGPVGGYTAGEAIEAYKRACRLHGWTIPPDFQAIEAQTTS